MSGVTIGWDSTTPGSTDLVGQGDDVIRSLKTNLQGGLAAEHLWPSAGGFSGAHLAGSARAFVGTASQVSSTDTTGRLMTTSDTSVMFYVGSEGTYRIGGRPTPFVPSGFGPTLSLASGYALSAFTVSVTSAGTATGPHSFPAGWIFTVTIDSISPSESSAYCTIKVQGLTGGLPVIIPYNGDGTAYSGATLIAHVIGFGHAGMAS